LHITAIEEMGQYAFDNLEGWKDFSKKAKKGDILIVGKNFGCGSSRQQAVDCFIALGIQAMVGESFGAIYKRNAINSGLPLLECEDIFQTDLKSEDVIEINLNTGVIKREGKEIIRAKPMSKIQMDIYQAGDLFAYGRKLE
ncbi:MAG: 3-isopropylmalate dehydratase, partial [Thermoplasmata archaeon]